MKKYKHKLARGVNPLRLFFYLTDYIAFTTLWGTVYYKSEEWLTNSRIVKHEECHLMQIEREGRLKFLYKYLMETYKNGYWNNKYEIEARLAEGE